MIEFTEDVVESLKPADRTLVNFEELSETSQAALTAAALNWQNQQDADTVSDIVALASLPPLAFDPATVPLVATETAAFQVKDLTREWEETWGSLDDPTVAQAVQDCCERLRKPIPMTAEAVCT